MSLLSHIARGSRKLKVEAILFNPQTQGYCSGTAKPPPAKTAAKPTSTPKAKPADTAKPPPSSAAAASKPPPAAASKSTASAASSFAYNSPATPVDPGQPVGPGASKTGDYPNTEYYTYNKMSYFDLEVEMGKDRIPQPSADNGHF
ncbi:hypothetical protein SK128_009011 [Halocaridina rubra]|uniref:NADH dehydrogenase [ubiquinone] flavoprotein 3, mitochondrial n=1 Tax=Halocaridina rubra TaxID=373956 RepID=A0AAN8ZWE1_HALRR